LTKNQLGSCGCSHAMIDPLDMIIM
jgi:hypothetical protein